MYSAMIGWYLRQTSHGRPDGETPPRRTIRSIGAFGDMRICTPRLDTTAMEHHEDRSRSGLADISGSTARMFSALSSVAVILNRQKSEVQQRDEDDRPVNLALEVAAEVEVAKLPESKTFVAPAPPPAKPKARPTEQQVNFTIARERLQEVMKFLELHSASAVGRHVFDYFYEAEIEN